jgi:hypothetical protein
MELISIPLALSWDDVEGLGQLYLIFPISIFSIATPSIAYFPFDLSSLLLYV